MDDNSNKKKINRAKALKYIGAGILGVATFGVVKGGLSLLSKGNEPKERKYKDTEIPKDKMTYRTDVLGRKIPLLGYGCMRFPTIKSADPDKPEQIDEVATAALVDYAMEHGVNYFDTAWPYHRGQSEIVMGKLLKKYPRESFYLASKMPTWEIKKTDDVKRIFETQLSKCQVDYFDYYHLHALTHVEAYEHAYEKCGALEYLKEQKAAGRIKCLGWSFHGNESFFKYMMDKKEQWDFIMIQMNYMDWLHGYVPAKLMYEMITERNIPVMIMEPLLGGTLAKVNRASTEKMKAARPNDSIASWAFRFAGSFPNVLTVLSGMTYKEHLQDNILTYSPLEPLTGDEFKLLETVVDEIRSYETIPCTDCKYCLPCPYGIDIPGTFTHYNKCVEMSNIPKIEGAMDDEYKRRRTAFLVGYDRVVPELQQADHCIDCKICIPKCPQKIDIPSKMEQIDKLMEKLLSKI